MARTATVSDQRLGTISHTEGEQIPSLVSLHKFASVCCDIKRSQSTSYGTNAEDIIFLANISVFTVHRACPVACCSGTRSHSDPFRDRMEKLPCRIRFRTIAPEPNRRLSVHSNRPVDARCPSPLSHRAVSGLCRCRTLRTSCRALGNRSFARRGQRPQARAHCTRSLPWTGYFAPLSGLRPHTRPQARQYGLTVRRRYQGLVRSA